MEPYHHRHHVYIITIIRRLSFSHLFKIIGATNSFTSAYSAEMHQPQQPAMVPPCEAENHYSIEWIEVGGNDAHA